MSRSRRLQATHDRISRLPFRYDAIDQAYARFLEDGTLPEDRTLAGAVLHRVLHARKPVPELIAEQRALGLYQPYGTTREMLFREAVCDFEPVRKLARLLLEAFVQAGHDPTDAELIGPEMEPMDYAPISLRLLHWPHRYVRPEYQGRLERVFRQQVEVRSHRPLDDDEWYRGAGAALSAFMTRGHIPTDSRYYLWVLSVGELLALGGQHFGRASDDLIAAYETVATSTGPQLEAALLRLGKLQACASEERG